MLLRNHKWKQRSYAESILPKKKKKMQSSYNLVRFSANYLFSSILKILIINQVWDRVWDKFKEEKRKIE